MLLFVLETQIDKKITVNNDNDFSIAKRFIEAITLSVVEPKRRREGPNVYLLVGDLIARYGRDHLLRKHEAQLS